jgi:hypothetical protein
MQYVVIEPKEPNSQRKVYFSVANFVLDTLTIKSIMLSIELIAHPPEIARANAQAIHIGPASLTFVEVVWEWKS